ncbi:MAG TPA: DegV family protein [Acidimicrobiales bacterium]|jgi:DegV family protein with EDD domain|nr:DegV family protein [Acidimicrobiales bacterium]
MSRIRVVTDSASDLPETFARRLDVDVVSLTIRFGDEEFTDRVDLTPDLFWAKCKSSKTLPETAAPSPGAFQAAYERAKSDGCDGVIVLTLSSLLSATHQSATLAAEAVAGVIDVRVLDTLNVSMGQGLIVIDVAELAATGAGLDELVAHAESLMPKAGVVAALDTLEHLIKGGRVGGAKALLGQVLSIKPLIELKGGIVAEAGRQRTRAKALNAVANAARSHAPLRRLALIQGACSDVAALEALIADIPSEFPLIVTDIGPVVGTHGGPGIIGLTWIEA